MLLRASSGVSDRTLQVLAPRRAGALPLNRKTMRKPNSGWGGKPILDYIEDILEVSENLIVGGIKLIFGSKLILEGNWGVKPLNKLFCQVSHNYFFKTNPFWERHQLPSWRISGFRLWSTHLTNLLRIFGPCQVAFSWKYKMHQEEIMLLENRLHDTT